MTGIPVGNLDNEAEYRQAAQVFWADVFGIPTSLIAEKVLPRTEEERARSVAQASALGTAHYITGIHGEHDAPGT